MDELHQRRIATIEDHCRKANGAIVDAMERFDGGDDHVLSLVCECGISECLDTVEATVREYTALRGDARRFIIRPDHVIAQVETVVATHADHWIIEKLDAGADEATRLAADHAAEADGR